MPVAVRSAISRPAEITTGLASGWRREPGRDPVADREGGEGRGQPEQRRVGEVDPDAVEPGVAHRPRSGDKAGDGAEGVDRDHERRRRSRPPAPQRSPASWRRSAPPAASRRPPPERRAATGSSGSCRRRSRAPPPSGRTARRPPNSRPMPSTGPGKVMPSAWTITSPASWQRKSRVRALSMRSPVASDWALTARDAGHACPDGQPSPISERFRRGSAARRSPAGRSARRRRGRRRWRRAPRRGRPGAAAP